MFLIAYIITRINANTTKQVRFFPQLFLKILPTIYVFHFVVSNYLPTCTESRVKVIIAFDLKHLCLIDFKEIHEITSG